MQAGNRIRRLRENLHMTREALAEKADVSAKFIYEIENGNKGFSAATLYRLANSLNVSCDYILHGDLFSENEQNAFQILKRFSPRQVSEICELLKGIYRLSAYR